LVAVKITIPSPQISEHVLALEELPDVQVHPVSTDQLESQPSPLTVLLSSQLPVATFITFPSPQISEQELAVVESPSVHVYPDSTAQEASHPSPVAVFPSSQYPAIGLITFPSPQISEHELALEELPDVHVHPVSTLQLESQPSPFTVLLSSQYPVAIFMTLPSPHISVQTLAVVESPKVHEYPVSMPQVALQPSPALVFPSSQ